MRHWPLGVKLTGWSVLVVSFALLICGVGTGLFIHHEQIETLDEQLRNEAHIFFGEMERRDGPVDWSDHQQVKRLLAVTLHDRLVEIVGTDGHSLYRSPRLKDAKVPALPAGLHSVQIGAERVRLGIFPKAGLTLRLGADLREVQTDTKEVILGFLAGLPLLLGTVVFGGWWLARQALAPVQSIAAAAEQITAERLDQRLPPPLARDEIGRLVSVLNAMFDRLDQSFRQAARFSADASHELKTPLTVLRSSIEDLLESPTLPEPDRRGVSALLEQTRRLTSITDSLLLLSRADAGRLKLDLADTDLCELATGCVDDATIMAEARGISIEAHLPANLRAHVDAGRVTQILLNLLDNAVKYNRDGGRISVAAEGGATGEVVICVANSGEGIPSAHASQIFERFGRVDIGAASPGCGLGLSLARELARAHGGELSLRGSTADWTEFLLRLPLTGSNAGTQS